MGALAELSESELAVVPGDRVQTQLRVRNAGEVVDEFTFAGIGDPAAWLTIEPAVLRLMPGVEEHVRVTLAPPREPTSTAGPTAFGVMVNSSEDPDATVVEEGVVDVAPFDHVVAEVVPRTSQGRLQATHELSVDNRGNGMLDARIGAWDADEALAFAVADPQLLLQPGSAAFTTIRVRPRSRVWRGPEQTLPFKVGVAAGEDAEPLEVDGTMLQRPLLPAWLPKALLALLALGLLLWLLWATLLQPEFESRLEDVVDQAAEDAVDEALEGPLEEQASALGALEEQVEVVESDLAEILPSTEPATEPPGTSTPTPTPTPVVVETSTDERLAVTGVAEDGSAVDTISIGADQTLLVTDVIFQNPRGNIGLVTLSRGGAPLLVLALENFRDLDYHFVVPFVISEGETLNLEVECDELVEPSTACSAFATVTGTLQTVQPPT